MEKNYKFKIFFINLWKKTTYFLSPKVSYPINVNLILDCFDVLISKINFKK